MTEVVTQEQLENFVMPRVNTGSIVQWYSTGKRGSIPQIGFVIRCMPRSIHILTGTAGVKEAVRHIDDPKLRLNPEQRETGGWDFTEDAKAQQAMLEDLDERLRALEKAVGGMTSSAARGEFTTSDDYNALKKKVADLGVQFKGNPARQWLEDQLKQASE